MLKIGLAIELTNINSTNHSFKVKSRLCSWQPLQFYSIRMTKKKYQASNEKNELKTKLWQILAFFKGLVLCTRRLTQNVGWLGIDNCSYKSTQERFFEAKNIPE